MPDDARRRSLVVLMPTETAEPIDVQAMAGGLPAPLPPLPVSGQLALDVEPPRANPNAHLLDNLGRPKWLMWCSDTARMGGRCPHGLDEPRERGCSPACCKAQARA